MDRSAWRVVLRLGQCLILVTASVLALAVPAPAEAYSGFVNYTYGSSSCKSGDYRDPLNYFFDGTSLNIGTESVAASYIRGYPVYWGQSPVGGDQWFFIGTMGCQKQNHQQADFVLGPKNHTRLRQGPTYPSGPVTGSPMHHDDLGLVPLPIPIPCELASSFNSARNVAYNKFRTAGFSQGKHWVGNTQAMLQCDGRYVSSDGYLYENNGVG